MTKNSNTKPRGFLGFFGRIVSGIFVLIVTVIRNRINGVYFETFLKAQHGADYDKMVDHKYKHYIEIRTQQPTTRSIAQYVDLLKDEVKWKQFEEEKMNCYFEDKIELFPYGGTSSGPVGLEKPGEFFLIQMDMVRRRFPGGDVEGDIGDNDIRKLISCLRYVFRGNYFSLIIARRKWAFAGIATAIASAAALTGSVALLRVFPEKDVNQEPVLYGYIVATVVIALLYGFVTNTVLRKFKDLTEQYSETVRHSCSVLARALEMRIQNIIATIPLIFTEIDNARYKYDHKEVRDLWPEEVKRWSKLAFWMAARVEHIELYLQAQMWRIRRIHYGAKSLAVLASWLILLLTGPFLIGLVWISLLMMPMPDFSGLTVLDKISLISVGFTGIATLVSIIVAVLSYKSKTPEIDLIEKTIQTNKMPRNHDVKLYNVFGDFLYREKKALLNEEDKLSGKKT